MTARTTVVTGCTPGIGHAIARRLAADGFALTLVGRDPETLARAATTMDAAAAGAASVTSVTADLGSDDAATNVAAAHTLVHDTVDVLVHAGGVGTSDPFADYPLRRVDRQWRVNARTPFALTQALLPALRAAALTDPEHGARVVALASIEGVATEPGLAAYSMTKAAVISLCESVSEYGHGVSATAISPGFVDTDMSTWAHSRVDPVMMIRPDDVAGVVQALTRMSRWAVVPHVVVTRPGPTLWRA